MLNETAEVAAKKQLESSAATCMAASEKALGNMQHCVHSGSAVSMHVHEFRSAASGMCRRIAGVGLFFLVLLELLLEPELGTRPSTARNGDPAGQ